MSDTTELETDVMVDPVTGEIIHEKKLAQQLLEQSREQGVGLIGPGGLLLTGSLVLVVGDGFEPADFRDVAAGGLP